MSELIAAGLADYVTTGHPERFRAHAAVSQWLLDIATAPKGRWVSLLGKSGTGKSMLARLARFHLKQHRPQSQQTMWKWARVLSFMREGNWGIIDQLARQPILILDEAFAEYAPDDRSGWDKKTLRTLSDLLDRRMGKWTLICDNRGFREVAEMETRISSRMLREGSVVVQFIDCPDWAMEQARKA